MRVTSPVHPLFGQLLQASGFKRRDAVLFLVVALPDGSLGTIPAAVTDVLGVEVREPTATALSVEGVQQLGLLVSVLRPARRSVLEREVWPGAIAARHR